MLGKVMLFGTGVAVGVAADRVAAELRKPAAEQFPGLRRTMNERVNPWLMEHGYPGSEHAEIGTLEHTGRRTGALYFTPVHPTLRGESVFIPVPLGDGSQLARNVVASGHARLQLHEELLDLDGPQLITVAEAGMVPPAVAGPFDRMGWRYVRFHVAGRVPGTFATHRTAEPAAAGRHESAPLDRPFAMPSETTAMEPAGVG
jgi:hypothetical protein